MTSTFVIIRVCCFPASTGRYPSWSDCTWDQIHYYLLWTYIHLYPKFDNFKRVMRVKGQGDGIGVKAFRDNIIPLAFRLAQAINELNWDARMDPRNHHVLFPTIFTGIVDTFPITISCPLSSQAQYLFFAKKIRSLRREGTNGLHFPTRYHFLFWASCWCGM